MAVDGKYGICWASEFDINEPATLTIDLGGHNKLQSASISWEFPAKSFDILTTEDGEHWVEAFSTNNNALKTTRVALPFQYATKVRLIMHEVCTERSWWNWLKRAIIIRVYFVSPMQFMGDSKVTLSMESHQCRSTLRICGPLWMLVPTREKVVTRGASISCRTWVSLTHTHRRLCVVNCHRWRYGPWIMTAYVRMCTYHVSRRTNWTP